MSIDKGIEYFFPLIAHASKLDERYEVYGDKSQLDAAANAWHAIVDDAAFRSADLEIQLVCLNDGGTSFVNRYQVKGHTKDLDIAIEWWIRATNLIESPDSDLLAHLGLAYHAKFQLLSDADDLQAAYDFCNEAVQVESNRMTTNQLGLVMMDMFHVVGNVDYLTGAKDAFERGLEYFNKSDLTSKRNSEEYCCVLNNLGMSLAEIMKLSSDSTDGVQAMACFEEAIKLSPNSPQLAIRLANLESIRRDLDALG